MYLKKTCAAALVLCLSLLLGSCRSESDVFPQLKEVPGSTRQTESETTAKNKSTDGIRNLKVALPYSDNTIRCLSAMFYSKNSGTWDKSVTGADVNIPALLSASTNYVIRNIGVTNDGASLENLTEWKDSGEEPDLFLASDTQSAAEAGLVSELSVSASRNKYIDGSKIFASSMSSQLEGGKLYGIPHYCSATVIFGNRDYIPKDGRLQAKYTTEDLTKYLELTNTSYKCVPIASAYKFVPYLGSCFSNDRSVSYMMNEEFKADREKTETLIASVTGYVKKLYDSKLSINTGKDGADPVFSRNAALWVDSSASCRTWEEYYPSKLYFLHLPCSNPANPGVTYLRPYSLCVSKKCEDQQFAVDFAAFISYDEDAQLLIYRMENMEGLLPLVRSAKVWNMAANEGAFGSMVSDFRQTMDNAVYCPGSFDNVLFRKTNEYTMSFFTGGNDRFYAEACYG